MFQNVFSGVMDAFSQDLAIDLGTSNTYIYAKGRGVVCREPSAVAVHQSARGERQVIAVGREAKAMLGRTPWDIQVVRPVRDGVIADFEITEAMLRYLLRGLASKGQIKPRAIVSIPYGTTEVERRAMRECAEAAGLRQVQLIEEPLAAAIGVGMNIGQPRGNMLIDVGGGTTEVAVVSMSEIVYSRSIRVGGDQIDDAIIQYLKRSEGLLVGPRTAEEIKIRLGSAMREKRGETAWVKGRDLASGYPRAVRIRSEQVEEAIAECVQLILETVLVTLEKTPPELASDIVDTGMVLTGGSAMLRNLDRALSRATGVPIVRAEDPMSTVARGSYLALERMPRRLQREPGLRLQVG
jgi:rod shape-determining protein MreB and related proteins